MFVAQARPQPFQQDLGPQPDFAALAGHVTAAMDQIKRIPNMPVVSHGTQFFELLQAMQSDLKKVHENVSQTLLVVHHLQGDVDETKLTLKKVHQDGEEVHRDIQKIQQHVEQVRTDVEQVRSDVEQVRSDVEQVRSDVEQVRSDVQQVRSDVEQVRSDITKLQHDGAGVRHDLDQIQQQVQQVCTDVTKLHNAGEGVRHNIHQIQQHVGEVRNDLAQVKLTTQSIQSDHTLLPMRLYNSGTREHEQLAYPPTIQLSYPLLPRTRVELGRMTEMQCIEAATHLGLAPLEDVPPFARQKQLAEYLGVAQYFLGH